MKNWQFFLSILILIILLSVILCIKVKESLQNDNMIYDINNTINYKESNFNVMNRELIEKNKTTILEEDILIEKNKQLAIDLPICSKNKEDRTNYLNNVSIPNLNSVNQKIADTKNSVAKLMNVFSSRNTNLADGIPYYTKELNICNSDVSKLEKEFDRKRNLPTGHYSIKSVKSGRYCTDTGDGVECNATMLQGWERFYIENHGGGLFVIRGGRENKLCSDDRRPTVFRCNRDHLGGWEYSRIVYQGNNVYSIRGGQGRLCSNTGRITCDRDNFDHWEKFIIEPWPTPADLPDGTYVFKGGRTYRNCTDYGDNIVCDKDYYGSWEKFQLTNLGNGNYSIKGGKNGQYCSDEGDRVRCDRNIIHNTEIFKIMYIGEGFYNIIGGRAGNYCADDNTFVCNRSEPREWERIMIIPEWIAEHYIRKV